MKCKTVWVGLFVILTFGGIGRLVAELRIGDARTDAKAAIRGLIEKYTQSISEADTKLAAEVWSTTPEVSFIHPLGSQHGWDEISSVVYTKLMGGTFSKRTLKPVGEPNIEIYNDAAVVTFNWDFLAVLRADGKELHTTGRETQVYAKLPGRGWRLVHVHYSGPATTMPSQP